MNPFVEECRREWKRLGVPDSIAEDMASELDTDLAEANADGVSAAEILGESDPRRFAAAWAGERGLVSAPATRRRRLSWKILAAVLALLVAGVVLGAILVVKAAPPSIHSRVGGPRAAGVSVPVLVGMKEREALTVVAARGLAVQIVHVPHRPAGMVVTQAPGAGARVPRGSTVLLRVGRAKS